MVLKNVEIGNKVCKNGVFKALRTGRSRWLDQSAHSLIIGFLYAFFETILRR
jgi:hypothetical protein